jgi:hypothetical protein
MGSMGRAVRVAADDGWMLARLLRHVRPPRRATAFEARDHRKSDSIGWSSSCWHPSAFFMLASGSPRFATSSCTTGAPLIFSKSSAGRGSIMLFHYCSLNASLLEEPPFHPYVRFARFFVVTEAPRDWSGRSTEST